MREGIRRLESLLSTADQPQIARARALIGAADMLGDAGDTEATRRYAEEALEICRAVGDRWSEAYVLLALGFPFAVRDQWEQARDRFAESTRIFTEIGDHLQALAAARRLAWTYEELGDLASARALREDNLRRARAIGDEHTEAQSLGWLAEYSINEGRIAEAVPMLSEAHRIHQRHRDRPDRWWDAILLCRFAGALARQGDATTAVVMLGCWAALFEEIEAGVEPWLAKKNDHTLAVIRATLDEAGIDEAWNRGRALTNDDAVALAVETLSTSTQSIEGPGRS